jgi:RNA ligase (TIGR02306 family)
MSKSTHKVEIVPVVLEPHPDPKTTKLSLIKVFGYVVVGRTADWEGVEKAAYIVPDTLVPNKAPFEFLFGGERSTYKYNEEEGTASICPDGEYARVTAMRLRGVLSHGLLVPAPEGMEIGDDAAEFFGVKRYEPEPIVGGRHASEPAPPNVFTTGYDVDVLLRYAHKFTPGELVNVSEKIHGKNGRWVFTTDHEGVDRMFAGSRKRWEKESDINPWWRGLEANPEITEFCTANPGVIVYGELYGVQKLKYGVDKPHIAVFDLKRDGKWVPINEAREMAPNLPWVPVVAEIPFDMGELEKLADGNSLIEGADHIREGIVIKPIEERDDLEIGRVILKLVSPSYLGNKKL